jgi:hypothetical protein
MCDSRMFLERGVLKEVPRRLYALWATLWAKEKVNGAARRILA